MNKLADQFKEKSTYLGKMSIYKDKNGTQRIKFESEPSWSTIRDMGDLVYFMYVGEKLMKIGKTEATNGFNDRANQYSQGEHKDKTNRKIFSVMRKLRRKVIDVYGISRPRQHTIIKCPISGETYIRQLSTARIVEIDLTNQYLDDGHDLPFCTQN